MAITGFEDDLHSEQGTACPRNYFGITDYSELSVSERVFGTQRLHELSRRSVVGLFDVAHLRQIHRYIFQDIFPWAGELRMVGIAKPGGAPFAPPFHIHSALAEALGSLAKENLLAGLNGEAFAERAAFYIGEINAIHPFREGNGRTQREFIRQLAVRAGFALSWAGGSAEENVTASVLSHTRGDNSGLARIIATAIRRGDE